MLKTVCALAILSLAACGGTDVVNRPVTVDVPVSVPCHVSEVSAPTFATTGITGANTTFDQARALAATNEQRKSYEAGLVAVNQACQ